MISYQETILREILTTQNIEKLCEMSIMMVSYYLVVTSPNSKYSLPLQSLEIEEIKRSFLGQEDQYVSEPVPQSDTRNNYIDELCKIVLRGEYRINDYNRKEEVTFLKLAGDMSILCSTFDKMLGSDRRKCFNNIHDMRKIVACTEAILAYANQLVGYWIHKSDSRKIKQDKCGEGPRNARKRRVERICESVKEEGEVTDDGIKIPDKKLKRIIRDIYLQDKPENRFQSRTEKSYIEETEKELGTPIIRTTSTTNVPFRNNKEP